MISKKIDTFHQKDLENEKHQSVFFKHEDYDLLILRMPTFEDSKLNYISLPFIITDDKYFFYDRTQNSFEDLDGIKGFYKYINRYVDKLLLIISSHWDIIELMEDKIYEGIIDKKFNKSWYIHKSDLVRINRLLTKALEIVNSLIKSYKKEEDFLERNFEDLHEHLSRSQRNAEFLLEKLDTIYNFNLNQTNEQMNKIIYILTVLSAIFLPLNLIVGFFGMNTSSLPFTSGLNGTFSVALMMVSILIITIFLTVIMKKKF